MAIETIFANMSCRDLKQSEPWYTHLFGRPPARRPMAGLVEWHFSDSAEVQLFENPDHAGHCTLTIGVLPLSVEVERLKAAGLSVGEIEEATHFYIMRMRDPDGNLVVLASAEK